MPLKKAGLLAGSGFCSGNAFCLTELFLDIFYSVSNGSYLLTCILVGYSDFESFFKFHDKFYCVKRIGTEIGCERCVLSDFFGGYTEFVHDDRLYFVCYR